jgi:hypothetical protein
VTSTQNLRKNLAALLRRSMWIVLHLHNYIHFQISETYLFYYF